MQTELFRRVTTRRTRMSAVVAGLVLTASLGAAPAAAAPRAAAPTRSPGAVTNLTGTPEAVSVISRSDAWAAQGFDVMLHWNGSTWAKVPITNDGQFAQFNSVSGDSPSDVWTVGESFGNGPVLEHWNGTAWTKAANPAGLPSSAELFGVSTVSRSDAWSVGEGLTSGTSPSVILHWNGAKWSRVSSPHARDASLASVTALSASDAWAVGSYGNGRHQLVLHWNGTTWSQVAIPQIAGLGLISISADSASDAWAVGLIDTAPPSTVALHWNGSTWSRVATPAPAPSPNPARGAELVGVDAVSPTLAFAVGWYNTYPIHGGASNHAHTLLLQWNGSQWTQVPSPGLGVSFGPGSFLNGVAASSRSNAWAVGSYDTGGLEGPAARTLMMHWDGSAWTRG